MASEEKDRLEDIEKCVRCGGCKALCPTLEEERVEPMGARGRLMLLREFSAGRLMSSELLNERIFSCILCGACSGACPLGVDVTGNIYKGRAMLAATDKRRRLMRSVVKVSARWPDLAFRVARMNRNILLPVLMKKGVMPFNLEFPDTPLRKTDQVFKVQKKKGRVAVFTGCSVNYLFPHLGESLINVLRKFGYEVVLPQGETCCGSPLRALGLEDETVEKAKRNYRVFARLNVEAVLSLCPTCTLTLKKEYPKIIGKGLENAMDVSVFLRDMLDDAGEIPRTAFYHDPCHLRYGLSVREEPRDVIRKAGIGLVDAGDPGCCGLGGLFCFSYREMSRSILQKRAKTIIDSGAETVVTSCPGCILQLSRTITDRPVLHLIEIVEEAYCDRNSESSVLTEAGQLRAAR